MTKMDGKKREARRGFLRGLALGSIAAAAATGAAIVPLSADAAPESPDERKKARYKETEHVKTFYRVNRY